MRGSVCLAITILAILSFLMACSPAASTAIPAKPSAPAAVFAATPATAANVKRGGTIRTHRGNNLDTADAHLGTAGDNIFKLVFDGLVRHDPDLAASKWQMKPQLAESWETPDPKTLVFKLRKGAKYHDGTQFDAASAKWNLERLRDHPKSRGKDVMSNVQSVDAVDDYTLRLNLKGPNASQLVWLAIGTSANRSGMLSRAAVDKMGDDEFGRRPVGSGPFEMVEFTDNNRTVVKKFEGYWEQGVDGKPLPYVDQVIVRFIQDVSVALIELKTGNLDFLSTIEPKDVASIKKEPSLDTLVFSLRDGQRYTIGVSPKNKPWGTDARLRRAMSVALDRDALSNTLGFGEGYPRVHILSPYELGYDDSLPKDPYNPAKAKQLLQEAGYPNGVDLVLTVISRPVDNRNAEIYKQMWDAVGIHTTIDAMERSAWVAKGNAETYEATTFNMSARPDPDQYTLDFGKDGGTNWVHYYNPEMEKCLEEGRSVSDERQRIEVYKRCQKIVYEDAYFIPTWGFRANFVFQKYLKDVTPQWEGWDVTYAWLDK